MIHNQTVIEQRPAPSSSVGAVAWLRTNLFNGPINTIFTLVGLYILYLLVVPTVQWAFNQRRLGRHYPRRLLSRRRLLGIYQRPFIPVYLRPVPQRGDLARQYRVRHVLYPDWLAGHTPPALQALGCRLCAGGLPSSVGLYCFTAATLTFPKCLPTAGVA